MTLDDMGAYAFDTAEGHRCTLSTVHPCANAEWARVNMNEQYSTRTVHVDTLVSCFLLNADTVKILYIHTHVHAHVRTRAHTHHFNFIKKGPFVQFYRTRATASLCITLRGYPGSTGSVEAEGEPGMYYDAVAAVEWMVSEQQIAKGNMIAHGFSLGGSMAAAAASFCGLGGLVS